MAISDFGTLKQALTDWRADGGLLSAHYTNATLLFEAVVNRGIPTVENGRKVVHFPRQMEASTDLTTASGSVALPSDYLAWRTVLWKGETPYRELDYVHPAYLRSTWIENDSAGDPLIFTIEGSTFYARPVDDTGSIFQFHYYQKLTTITSGDGINNWLLLAHPDAYLWGVLAELEIIAEHDERAALYKARRDELFSEIAQLSAQTTGATSSMVRESEYF